MHIESHVFKQGVVPGRSVFVLESMPHGSLYLTEEIVEDIQTYGFTGTEFAFIGEA